MDHGYPFSPSVRKRMRLAEFVVAALAIVGFLASPSQGQEQPWLDEFPTADAAIQSLVPKPQRPTDNQIDIAARQVAALLYLRDAALLLGGATDRLGGDPTRALTAREAQLVGAYEQAATELTTRTVRGIDGDFAGSPKPSDVAFTAPAANYRSNATFQRATIGRHFSKSWQAAYPPVIAARQKSYDDAMKKQAADERAAERERQRAAAQAEREAARQARQPAPSPPANPAQDVAPQAAGRPPAVDLTPFPGLEQVIADQERRQGWIAFARLVTFSVAFVFVAIAWIWAMSGRPRLGSPDPRELVNSAFRLGVTSGVVAESDKTRAVWTTVSGSGNAQSSSVSSTVHREVVNDFRLHLPEGGVRDVKLLNWDVAIRPGDPIMLVSFDLKEGSKPRWGDPLPGTFAWLANGTNGERWQREGEFRKLLAPSPKTGVLLLALALFCPIFGGWEVVVLLVAAGVLFFVHRSIVAGQRLAEYRREWKPVLNRMSDERLAQLQPVTQAS